MTTPRWPRMAAWLDSPLVTRAVQLAAVLSLGLALIVGVRQYSLANCLAGYNDRFAAAQEARIAASEQDRRALDAMLETVANNPREAITAIRTYTQQRAEADKRRSEHPLPAPPSERC